VARVSLVGDDAATVPEIVEHGGKQDSPFGEVARVGSP